MNVAGLTVRAGLTLAAAAVAAKAIQRSVRQHEERREAHRKAEEFERLLAAARDGDNASVVELASTPTGWGDYAHDHGRMPEYTAAWNRGAEIMHHQRDVGDCQRRVSDYRGLGSDDLLGRYEALRDVLHYLRHRSDFARGLMEDATGMTRAEAEADFEAIVPPLFSRLVEQVKNGEKEATDHIRSMVARHEVGLPPDWDEWVAAYLDEPMYYEFVQRHDRDGRQVQAKSKQYYLMRASRALAEKDWVEARYLIACVNWHSVVKKAIGPLLYDLAVMSERQRAKYVRRQVAGKAAK